MLDLRCLIGFSVLLWNDVGLDDSLFKTEKNLQELNKWVMIKNSI